MLYRNCAGSRIGFFFYCNLGWSHTWASHLTIYECHSLNGLLFIDSVTQITNWFRFIKIIDRFDTLIWPTLCVFLEHVNNNFPLYSGIFPSFSIRLFTLLYAENVKIAGKFSVQWHILQTKRTFIFVHCKNNRLNHGAPSKFQSKFMLNRMNAPSHKINSLI